MDGRFRVHRGDSPPPIHSLAIGMFLLWPAFQLWQARVVHIADQCLSLAVEHPQDDDQLQENFVCCQSGMSS
jgi:hypothetical protein